MSWDAAYREGWAPWDIGRPQPAFLALADRGEFVSPVLDSGCGTGENSLLLAGRGLAVTGVDIAPTAIAVARQKAAHRGLDIEFMVGDALELSRYGRTFASVVDCGLFHTFDDDARAAYVESLAGVVTDGGVIHLLCFSELAPGTRGPRRVTQAELRLAFARGWRVERIEESRFDVVPGFDADRPHAWLARIVRRELGEGAGR